MTDDINITVVPETTDRRAHSRVGTRGVRQHKMRLPAALAEVQERGILGKLSYRERAELSARINREHERAMRRREMRGREFDLTTEQLRSGVLLDNLSNPSITPERAMMGFRDTRRRGGITDEEYRNAMRLLWPSDRRFALRKEE